MLLEEVIKQEEREKHVLPREGLFEKCMKSVEEGTGKYFKRRKRGRYLCEFCEQDEQYSQQVSTIFIEKPEKDCDGCFIIL